MSDFVPHTVCDQVIDKIIRQLLGGDLSKGKKLPADREFSELYNVNRQTIHQAMSVLAAKGIVERRPGAGTFLLLEPAELAAVSVANLCETAAHKMIGVVMSLRAESFARQLLEAFQEQSAELQIATSIRTVSDKPGPEIRQAVKQLVADGCGAVVLAVPNLSNWMIWLPEIFADPAVPIITLDLLPGLESHHFNLGRSCKNLDVEGVVMAIRHFCEHDFREIAFLGPEKQREHTLVVRLMAYCREINLLGLRQHIGLIADASADISHIVELWNQLPKPVAVVCYDDDYALLLLNELHRRGLAVPAEFAVIGFNDSPLGSLAIPALSSIKFNCDYLAAAVLKSAVARAVGAEPEYCPPVLPELVIRKSSVTI